MIDTPVRASAAETEPCAASAQEVDGDRVAGEAWTGSHRNALAAAEPQTLAWPRIVALALALALHLAVLLRLTIPPPAWLPAPTKDMRDPVAAIGAPTDGLRVVFVEPAATADPGDVAVAAIVTPPAPASVPSPILPASDMPATLAAPSAMAPKREPPAVAPATVERLNADVLPSVTDASTPAARLFRPDGSVALPTAAIADLRAMERDDRTFDYMTPGLADAASAFSRRPTLPYAPTRFDADWQPPLEVLTYENERKSFRCSLLPPGCSWGRVDAAAELDDPHTLNPIESAQCRGLWDAIVAATDQSEWLKLRSRFDNGCRKPLERDRAPPAPATADPARG